MSETLMSFTVRPESAHMPPKNARPGARIATAARVCESLIREVSEPCDTRQGMLNDTEIDAIKTLISCAGERADQVQQRAQRLIDEIRKSRLLLPLGIIVATDQLGSLLEVAKEDERAAG